MSGQSKAASGSVTVFLALSFVLITALLLTIVESARTTAQRLYIQVACDSAMESLFSQFHRPLWESYRILGLEYRDDADLTEEFHDFLLPYLTARDLFPFSLSEDDILFSEHVHLDEDISYEEEILDYMKYGLADTVLTFARKGFTQEQLSSSLKDGFRHVTESEPLSDLQKSYALDTKLLEAMEDALNELQQLSEDAENTRQSLLEALSAQDAQEFYSASATFQALMPEFPPAVQKYNDTCEQLSVQISEMRQDFESRRSSLSSQGSAAVEAELQEYESYLSESSSVRQKILQLPALSETVCQLSVQLEERVREFEEWLENAREEERRRQEAMDEEDSGDSSGGGPGGSGSGSGGNDNGGSDSDDDGGSGGPGIGLSSVPSPHFTARLPFLSFPAQKAPLFQFLESGKSFRNFWISQYQMAVGKAYQPTDTTDEEEDFSDLDAAADSFYQECFDTVSQWQLPSYQGLSTQINKQNKRLLDHVRELTTVSLLSLVLPQGIHPSKEAVYPEAAVFHAESLASPVELALMGEYELKYFSFYHPVTGGASSTGEISLTGTGQTVEGLNQSGQSGASPGSIPPSGCTGYENEFLLCGKSSDYLNLTAYTERLLALREGVNLIYLLSSPEKRSEARTFAASFLIATSNPVLLSVFTFFVLGVWALGQAIADVRELLSGGRVPLLHDAASWSVGLSDLLSLGKGQAPAYKESSQGLSYRDYLRIYLYGEGALHQALLNNRMLSRIQDNLQSLGTSPEPQFEISQCLYALRSTTRTSSRHIMYQSGLVRMAAGSVPDAAYSQSVTSYYKYRNETQ